MDAATIEQMNKVRVSLGMAPLPVPGKDSAPQFKGQREESVEEEDLSTLEKRQAAAGANWERLEAERQEKLEREKRKAAAKKARDVAARYAKMEGKGLGDADEEELDTRSWLLQQKKRQKKIEKARKLEEELAAREREAQLEYTSKDLAGVKVGHEAAEFDEITGEQVLTLKDTGIGDESEDDELENADLRAKEKLEERLRLKKKRPDYDPTEQNDVKNVLSKYDEEIDGKRQKRFTLDDQGNAAEAVQRELDEAEEVKSKGVKISLDMLKDDAPVSDYIDPSTIKVKKPKKRKEKKTRQKAGDDDDIFPPAQPAKVDVAADTMEIDRIDTNGTTNGKKRAFEFDDEDLQAKLTEQRRQALKKRKKMDGAELARQMREEMPVDEEEAGEGGMVMDETSEFVANLKKLEAPEARARLSRTPHPATADNVVEDEDGDTTMAQSYAEAADAEDRPKREESGTPAPGITATGLEDEDTLSGAGTAGTLALLRKRGLLSDASSSDLSAKERQRAHFLATKQHLIDAYDAEAKAQRQRDRESGRFTRMTNRERDEYARKENDRRETYIAKLLADMFNAEYRPDVKLRYHDEYGREMGVKEAFKHLSHMFHGKGSGKQKTEKRLKKIEDEKKEIAKGVLHAGEEGGFMNVQGREGKRRGQAGVRLQVLDPKATITAGTKDISSPAPREREFALRQASAYGAESCTRIRSEHPLEVSSGAPTFATIMASAPTTPSRSVSNHTAHGFSPSYFVHNISPANRWSEDNEPHVVTSRPANQRISSPPNVCRLCPLSAPFATPSDKTCAAHKSTPTVCSIHQVLATPAQKTCSTSKDQEDTVEPTPGEVMWMGELHRFAAEWFAKQSAEKAPRGQDSPKLEDTGHAEVSSEEAEQQDFSLHSIDFNFPSPSQPSSPGLERARGVTSAWQCLDCFTVYMLKHESDYAPVECEGRGYYGTRCGGTQFVLRALRAITSGDGDDDLSVRALPVRKDIVVDEGVDGEPFYHKVDSRNDTPMKPAKQVEMILPVRSRSKRLASTQVHGDEKRVSLHELHLSSDASSSSGKVDAFPVTQGRMLYMNETYHTVSADRIRHLIAGLQLEHAEIPSIAEGSRSVGDEMALPERLEFLALSEGKEYIMRQRTMLG
ncbi:hypothetical protein BAUCODRAFT_131959 [Baudoinia panamericana UAMH 10762]|uniref:SART-1 protein n=1 Tax=Baudoinia panamericana (strain UAMH 10762) TaxID=717646 RepID=M2MU58_BAUPA|nr:uncharacterized protein BAUCODRAFT_131959 [Baudoinia panamericana UAMH 10762]EMC95093.1 hypothetical protein BAUCODRAFT_131959 [Baudoinia panamericana UAMH 10762]